MSTSMPTIRSPPVPAPTAEHGCAELEIAAGDEMQASEVVERFARFVAALADRETVEFRADEEVVRAVVAKDGAVEITVQPAETLVNFAVQPGAQGKLRGDEIFLLSTTQRAGSWQLQLSYTTRVISYVAAHHLLRAAAAYLTQDLAPAQEVHRWRSESLDFLSPKETLSTFAQRHISHCASTLQIPAAEISAILPATPTTSSLLPPFLRDRSYVQHTVFTVAQSMEAKRLLECWQAVLRRHDASRTVFVVLDNEGLAPFALCVLAEESKHAQVAVYESGDFEAALKNAAEGMQLRRPAVALTLVSAETNKLVVTAFQGLFDVETVRLLAEEVTVEYHGLPGPARTEMAAATRAHFGASTDRSKAYWARYLAGFEAEPFPCLSGRSPNVVKKVTESVEILSKTRFAEMEEKCVALGVTPLAVLQAGWASMLTAFSESMAEDVVFGCVHDGRSGASEKLKNCIGPLFTTVPVRVNIGPQEDGNTPTNAAVLAALDIGNMDALSHLQTPLRSLVSADGSLPYDTVVEFNYTRPTASTLWDSVHSETMKSDFAITIEAAPLRDGSLSLKVTYRDTHIIEAEARGLLEQLDDVMQHILANPKGDIRDCFSGVRDSLSGAGNRKPVEDNIVPFLHSQFENHAASHPDDIALVYKSDLKEASNPENVEWTYAELNARANRLANHLVNKYGPLNDVSVPVCVEKTPALYIAILGVLKAGGGWCPIGTDFPVRRRHDLIVRTGAKMLLCAGNTFPQPADSVPEGVELVNIDEALLNGLDDQPAVTCDPSNLAYLIWTSGTTGPPKGVPIEHHSGVASMTVLQHDIPTDVPGGVRCLQFAAYTFDVFVQDLFYTWGVGGTLISSTHPIMIGSMGALATTTGATHAHLTPAYAAGVPRKSCPTLKVITMIGERLGDAVAQDWAQDMRAYNTYGPAEATVVSTLRQFRGKEDDLKAHNVGIPMSSVSCYLIRHNRLTIKGGVGELALGGPHLTRGYLNDPKKSAEKLIFHPAIGERVYLTGDIVRYLHNGTIEFVGRTDDQVKLGGIRIELSEISAAMTGFHPLAERIETMHIGRPDRPAKVLVTFISAPSLPPAGGKAIVCDKALEIAKAAIKSAQSELPEFMLPSVYCIINGIPVTPSNKIDRVALNTAYASLDMDTWETRLRATEQTTNKSGLSDAELVIAKLVSKITEIPVESVRTTAGLRALGIDSIRAIQLTAALADAGHEVSMVHVLRSRTIGELASHIKTFDTASSASAPTEPVNPRIEAFQKTWHKSVSAHFQTKVEKVLPASPLQEGLLSETLRTPAAYWSNLFYKLQPSISIPRLQQAWEKTAVANEALRTAFMPLAMLQETDISAQSSTFLQLIHEKATVAFEVILTTPEELQDVARGKAAAICNSADLSASPWAVTVLDAGSERVMMLTLHHAIHDGPSLSFIAADVQAAYLGYKLQPRTQLADAVVLMWPSENAEEDSRKFWEEELKEFADPEANVWPDLTGTKQTIAEGAHKEYLYQKLPLSTPATALSQAAKDLGTSSTATIVAAAWGVLLADYLESPQVVFGETLSSRIHHSSLNSAIAPLISVLPFPCKSTGTTRQLLAEHARRTQLALQHHHLSPSETRRILQRPRTQALYPATYVFHPTEDESTSILFAAWEDMADFVGLTVEHPLALNVYSTPEGGLELEFSADTALMGKVQLDMLARQVDALVAAMIAAPDMPVAMLSGQFPTELLSVAPSRASESVVAAFNDSPTKWVELYAQEHPEWQACEVASEITLDGAVTTTWDYATLNGEANRVANFIAMSGVDKRMIAVCVGRTLEAYSTILGVIKSGNTYLPVDESLPVARKVLLVEDSEAAMLFTTTELAGSFREHGIPAGCKLVIIDAEPYTDNLTFFSPENRICLRNDPQAPVYLLYTSGSTGKPKGVVVTRGNLSGFTESQYDFFCAVCPATATLGGRGKYLGLASRAFDVHVAEMFLAWRYGFSTATAPRAMLLDDLGLALQKLHVTHASFVPSLLDQADLLPADVPELKFLGVGGEKISQRVLDTWAASEDVALVNAYGPTEVTICCTALNVRPDATVRNIGHLVGHITGYVFVPGTTILTKRGQPGELCITGDLVAQGYLNRPDAGGFFEYKDTMLYRTGDMVRMMIDDSLEYLGRSDDQAKIRGQRLELGEVSEGVRESTKEVLDVASLVAKHPELSRPQLVTFVARAAGRVEFKDEAPAFLQEDYENWAVMLQNGCRERMPAYMVPDTIIPITIMPLAPMSGKADGKQLRALFGKIPLNQLLRRGGNAAQEMPERDLTEMEEKVKDALMSVVTADPTHIVFNSSVFEFGIDSLSAITLSVRLKARGINASVVDVMTRPVIEELAKVGMTVASVEAEKKVVAMALAELKAMEGRLKAKVAAVAGVPEQDVKAIMPCLPLQEGIIARSMNSENGPTYVNHVVLKLVAGVDAPQLRAAWKEVVLANDILNTVFCQPEEDIVQVVLRAGLHFSFTTSTVADAAAAAEAERLSVAAEIIENLHRLPPIRLHLFEQEGGDSLLAISVHHSIYDGESFIMLLDEVYARYEGQPALQRAPFSNLVEYLASQRPERAQAFWSGYLKEARPTHAASVSGYRDGEASVSLSTRKISAKLSNLEKYASTLKSTLPSVAQTIFGVLLAQRLGHGDVIFGSVLSGRTVPVPDVATILAPCITTIPFRVNILNAAPTASVNDIVQDVHKASVKALEWQHTSLRHIQRWVGADKPLFDCLFSYVRAMGVLRTDALWEELNSEIVPDYPFAIEFEANPDADELMIRAAFTPAFGAQNDVDDFMEKIDILLAGLVNGETATLQSLGVAGLNAVSTNDAVEVYDEDVWSQDERTIQKLVAEICEMEVSKVKKADSFFRLGIDSVTAIRLAKRIRDTGIRVSSSDIVRYPSIGALAAVLGKVVVAKEAKAEVVKPLGLEAAEVSLLAEGDVVEAMYACTPLQAGMLTHTLASSEGRLYVHHHAVELVGCDVERLRKAWEVVVARSDILRTTFHAVQEVGHSWVAAVHKMPEVCWLESAGSLEGLVEEWVFVEEEAFRVPPVKASVLEMEGRKVFVVSMHHALYDGASVPMIFNDLALEYAGEELPTRPLFAEAARLIAQNGDLDADFWPNTLKDYQVVALPQLPVQAATSEVFVHSKTLSMAPATIIEKCKTLEATFQSVALLAWSKVLSTLVGRRDIVFGHVVAGRSLPMDSAESIIGPLFNTVPFRLTLDQSLQTNANAVEKIQQFTAASQGHQHASLRSIQSAWRKQTGSSESALFDTLFVFQKVDGTDAPDTEALWKPLESDSAGAVQAEYAVNLEIEQGDAAVVISAAAQGEYLSSQRLVEVLQMLEETILEILNNPERLVLAHPQQLRALPVESVAAQVVEEEEDNTPFTADEEIVRGVMAEVAEVPVEQITRNASIYSFGLDSIAAITLASKCRRKGVNVGVSDILQGGNIAGICARVRVAKALTRDVALVPLVTPEVRKQALELLDIDESKVEAVLPVLAGQLHHLEAWLESGRTSYEPTWSYVSKDRLDLNRLQSAWRQLRERHSILRTAFAATSTSNAVQVVLKPAALDEASWTFAETTESFDAAGKPAITAITAAPSSMFTPPVRMHILRCADKDAVFITLHHTTYDGWSIPTLITDLTALYTATPLPAAPSFTEFTDFTLRSARPAESKAYWASSLANAQPTIIPASEHSSFLLSRTAIPEFAKLDKVCREHNTPLHTLLLHSIARALAKVTHTQNPTFGLYQVGRSASFDNLATLCGPTLNVTPLSIAAELTPQAAVAAIRDDLAKRVQFEQDYLRDIESPEFNVFVNVLWHTKEMVPEQDEAAFLEHVSLGLPSDFVTGAKEGATAVDALKGAKKAGRVFVDVGPGPEGDGIDFGIKSEKAWTKEEMEVFVGLVREEVEGAVEGLRK